MISANTSCSRKGRIYNTLFRDTRIIVQLFGEAPLPHRCCESHASRLHFCHRDNRRDAGRLMCRTVPSTVSLPKWVLTTRQSRLFLLNIRNIKRDYNFEQNADFEIQTPNRTQLTCCRLRPVCRALVRIWFELVSEIESPSCKSLRNFKEATDQILSHILQLLVS